MRGDARRVGEPGQHGPRAHAGAGIDRDVVIAAPSRHREADPERRPWRVTDHVASLHTFLAALAEPIRRSREHVNKARVLRGPSTCVIDADGGTIGSCARVDDNAVSRGEHRDQPWRCRSNRIAELDIIRYQLAGRLEDARRNAIESGQRPDPRTELTSHARLVAGMENSRGGDARHD